MDYRTLINKGIIIKVVVLLIIISIMITPMIRHNGIVENIEKSSDMKTHTDIIKDGSLPHAYYGQMILHYLFKPFANNSHLNTIYLSFSFALLIIVAYLIYALTNNVLAVTLVLFTSTGILGLFKYGVIFNIINMYIILIGAIYFTSKWFTEKKAWYLLVALVLYALFSMFHYTALYLPYVVGLAVTGYCVYTLLKKDTRYVYQVVAIGFGIIVINAVLTHMFINNATELSPIPYVYNPDNIKVGDSWPQGIFGTFNMIVTHMSWITSLLLVGIIASWHWLRKSLTITSYDKVIVYIIGCFAVCLLFGVIFKATNDYNRLALDLATMTAIFVAYVMGIMWRNKKLQAVNISLGVLIIGCAVPNIITWVR